MLCLLRNIKVYKLFKIGYDSVYHGNFSVSVISGD